MPRPWTPDDDRRLRNMYVRDDTPIQLIRDTLHRGGPDIHARARELGLQRPGRSPSDEKRDTPWGLPRALEKAAETLRRNGFAPVYAERLSIRSTRLTGRWVVGIKVMEPDQLMELARKYENG
jgi:hypothetical protein